MTYSNHLKENIGMDHFSKYDQSTGEITDKQEQDNTDESIEQ